MLAKCRNDAKFVYIEPELSTAVIDDDNKNPVCDPMMASNNESKHTSCLQN